MKHLPVGLLVSLLVVCSAHAGQYSQDFSAYSAGTTSFGDGSVLYSDQLGTVAAVQDSTFKELGLTASGTGSTHSAFLLPDLDSAEPVYAFSAKWNSQVYGNFPNAADGFSFTFGQVGSLNLISGNTQEDGYGTGITFSVHTYTGNSPGFYLKINGTNVAAQPYSPGTQWGTNNNTRHFFEVNWNYTNGVSVSMDGQAIFTNVATPGYTIQGGNQFVWAARCGGLSEEVRLDNIVVVTGGNLVEVPMTSPYFSDANNIQSPANAFDGNLNTVWEDYNNTVSPTGVVGGTAPAATAVKAYALVSPYATDHLAGAASSPTGWLFQGSANGSSWNVLGAGAAHFLNALETRCFLVSNARVYPDYELNVNAVNGLNGLGLAELRFYKLNPVVPGVWTQQSGAPVSQNGGGYYLAGSSNLMTIAQAVSADGLIYYSTNFGATWAQSEAPKNIGLQSIASSWDGTKMVSGGMDTNGNGLLYCSTNSGANWTAGASFTNGSQIYSVAMSADGTKVAAACNGGVFFSADSGHTWARSNTTVIPRTIASSADGTKLIGSDGVNQHVFVSTNSGATWSQTFFFYGGGLVCSSADGTRLFATSYTNLYVSSDSGATWTLLPSAPVPISGNWGSIACSADGTKIAAGIPAQDIYTSVDSGVTWIKSSLPSAPYLNWLSIASSAGGAKLETMYGWTYAPVSVAAPSAVTLVATAVQVQGATLNGAVNPANMPTAAWFNWGTSTAYGQTAALTNLNGNVAITNSAVLSGLTPSTTYHFQMVGSNTLGVTPGPDMTFTTSATLPPVVTTLPANQLTPASAQLNASVNPELLPTGAWFQWGIGTNYGNSTPAQNAGSGGSSVAASATVTNLAYGTYHCRVVATNSQGTSYGADVLFDISSSNAWFNIAAPGDSITPTSTNSPAVEGVTNAIDGDVSTKYLNFDKTNAGFSVSPANAASQPVRAVSLISASDTSERDPASFALYGSTDGISFILIASNAVPAFPGRNAIQTFPVANSNIYSSYRIIFPTVQNPSTANSMQIGEVEFLPYGELTESYGSVQALPPAGAALNTDGNGAAGALVDLQVGGNANKILVTNDTGNFTVLLTPVGPAEVKGLEIIGGDDDATYPGRAPSFVQLEGSNDGTNFVPLLFDAMQAPTTNMQIQSFAMLSNTNRFAKYRVTFGPPMSGDMLQVGELRLFGVSHAGVIPWTAQSAAGSNYWNGIACSADGTKLAASAGDYSWGNSTIFTSRDFGASWQASGAPPAIWACLASSADGTKLVAGQGFLRYYGFWYEGYGYLFASADSGTNWQYANPNNSTRGIAMAADGKQVLAAEDLGGGDSGLFISTDYGADFTRTATSITNTWSAVASSVDGTKLAAAAYDRIFTNAGPIYVSADSGTTWSLTTAPTNYWTCLASSADGAKLAAAANGGTIYLSTNSGATWAPSSAPAAGWVSIASSADGTKLIAAAGSLYISTDSGATWTTMSAPANQWASVACSADGTKLMAAANRDADGNPGFVYTWRLPVLTTAVAANHLAITWTTNQSGLELQTTTSLTTPVWTTVTNAATVVNGHYQILLTPSGPNAFYRLGAQ